MGAVDYIKKPFSINELKLKIKNLFKVKLALSDDRLKNIEEKLNKLTENKEQAEKRKNDEISKISEIDIKILSLLKEGLIYKEMEIHAGINENAIKARLKRLRDKFHVGNNDELISLLDKNL